MIRKYKGNKKIWKCILLIVFDGANQNIAIENKAIVAEHYSPCMVLFEDHGNKCVLEFIRKLKPKT